MLDRREISWCRGAPPSNERQTMLRYFHQLPPLLRVVSLLQVLCGLAGFVVLLAMLIPPVISNLSSAPPQSPNLRLLFVGVDLFFLSMACLSTVSPYTERFRWPDGVPFPLDSWQSQVRALAVRAVLPLGALVLMLVVPPGAPIYFLASVLSVLAAIANVVALAWATRVWGAVP